MIFVFTALYPEAQFLIRELELHKLAEPGSLQHFINNEKSILLTITGAGPVAAAAGVGAVLGNWMFAAEMEESGTDAAGIQKIMLEHGILEQKHSPFWDAELVNYGSCAGSGSKDKGLYRCAKLRNMDSGKTFYPDLLWKSRLPEAEICTGSKIYCSGIQEPENTALLAVLYDMEAAAVYEAANFYLGPHQMHFLKCVTDHGDEEMTPERLKEAMTETAGEAADYIRMLQTGEPVINSGQGINAAARKEKDCSRGSFAGRNKTCGENIAEVFHKFCEEIHASVTMQAQIRQLFHYAVLLQTDPEEKIRQMEQEQKLPCIDKREGKKRLDELRRSICGENI